MSSCKPTSHAVAKMALPGWNEFGPSSQMRPSALRVVMLPPTRSRASTHATAVPGRSRSKRKAEHKPETPAPTTTASRVSSCASCCCCCVAGECAARPTKVLGAPRTAITGRRATQPTADDRRCRRRRRTPTATTAPATVAGTRAAPTPAAGGRHRGPKRRPTAPRVAAAVVGATLTTEGSHGGATEASAESRRGPVARNAVAEATTPIAAVAFVQCRPTWKT
mmetsp:Transcript_119061/g.344365  ORF Transcript_119061/g.344365 Transcript_119061/m.344365 type:complete len:223 (+) Transcript_119061:123-791(+)